MSEENVTMKTEVRGKDIFKDGMPFAMKIKGGSMSQGMQVDSNRFCKRQDIVFLLESLERM